jgi:hypothetical protein
MDPLIYQLFTVDEILERLAQKWCTGCLHIFTPKEAANVFFKDGTVISASKGLVEGEEVLRQVLGWKDAHTVWQPDLVPPTTPAKPLHLAIADFLDKPNPEVKVATPPPQLQQVYLTVPAKGAAVTKATVSVPLKPIDPAQAAVTEVKNKLTEPVPVPASIPAELTATKTMPNGPSSVRSAQEEALLKKHSLTLVLVDHPEQRLKIHRVSCLIGRNPACDLTIDHPSISRQHCLLQISERGLHVKDLDTTNGTKVNGIVLKEGYISVGDKLTIGHLPYLLERA